MNKKRKEMKLFYNSEKKRDREIYGYATSLNELTVNEQDLSKTNLTEQQLAELADTLNISISELIDKNDDLYIDKVKAGSFEDSELLKLMNRNYCLIKTPIAVVDKKGHFVNTPYELISKDIEIGGVKSSKGNRFEKEK